MFLYLTRHGETVENVKGIVQSKIGGELTDKGRSQAEKLGKSLEWVHLNYIFSSDLGRAVDTAKIVLGYQQNCIFATSKDLREADFGKYQGMKKQDIDWRNANDIESQKRLQQRQRKFYIENLAEFEVGNKKILVITHAGTMKALTSVLMNKHYDEIWDMETPENASLSLFEIDSKKVSTIYRNCTRHL